MTTQANIFRGELDVPIPVWEEKIKDFSPTIKNVLNKAKREHDLRLIRRYGEQFAEEYVAAFAPQDLIQDLSIQLLAQISENGIENQVIPVFADFIRRRKSEAADDTTLSEALVS